MAWKVNTRMKQVSEFVVAWEAGLESKAALCRRFGVSRKTGYALIKRYRELGAIALLPRAPVARSHPNRTGAEVRELIIKLRSKHPTWGPRKLKRRLESDHPNLTIPAASTIGTILKHAGLVQPRKRRTRHVFDGVADPEVSASNDCWNADFKGQYRLGDGTLCFTLTVTDSFSRKLLCCKAFPRISTELVREAFALLFKRYGLPRAIRTDNGAPFASLAAGGVSRLSAWWLELGIEPIRITPGKPQQNGAHERMHRVLKAECTKPAASSMRAHQRQLDEWMRVYNELRPHEAIGMRTPDALYQRSPRAMPKRLAAPVYAESWQVRSVRQNGEIKFGGCTYFVSEALIGQRIGLEALADGRLRVWFATLELGVLSPMARLFAPRGTSAQPRAGTPYSTNV